MIKIHNKLWYIQNRTQEHYWKTKTYGEVVIHKLSYMTYFESNKAFDKRCDTGCYWASLSKEHLNVDDGVFVDNTPQEGFKVVESVSRWSTSNKLFRIEDPRGFVVEIPTGNLATLLLDTTVINGVIQGGCVWGREGSNHVLLPITSEPYIKARSNMKILKSELIKPRDLKAGDWVTLLEDQWDKERIYFAGRGKITWKNMYTGQEVVDTYQWIFITFYRDGDTTLYTTSSFKITNVVKNEHYEWEESLRFPNMPKRIEKQFTTLIHDKEKYTQYGGSKYVHDNIEIIGVEYK